MAYRYLINLDKAMYYLLSRPWVNMIGKFETPHVIGKCANPRALKNVRSLPSVWRHDKPAWMTSKLFEEAVSRFSEMRREGHHVLLFLDNAPCHPKLTFNNVKLVFFLADMTSHIQPLDQGIIQAINEDQLSQEAVDAAAPRP